MVLGSFKNCLRILSLRFSKMDCLIVSPNFTFIFLIWLKFPLYLVTEDKSNCPLRVFPPPCFLLLAILFFINHFCSFYNCCPVFLDRLHPPVFLNLLPWNSSSVLLPFVQMACSLSTVTLKIKITSAIFLLKF